MDDPVAAVAPDGGSRAPHADRAATVRDRVREVVGSDCGRRSEHPLSACA